MAKMLLTTNPHLRSPRKTWHVMLDVLIALVPAAVAACVLFSLRALALIAVCVCTAVLSEFLFNLICRREQTVGDLSACVTGLLLALNLPYTMPLWEAALGSVVAVVVVKCLFGGIGKNFANPAITARIVLLLSFTETGKATVTRYMTAVDGVTTPTPLNLIAAGRSAELPSLLDMFLGNRGGAMGETCVAALLLGGIYLLARRVITWHAPVAFIGTVFLFSLIVKGDFTAALYQVMGGGLVLGAFFMATDYTTTPLSRTGRLLFGLGCGLITCVIRFWGSLPEGVSYSILLMNILTPYLDKVTAPKVFGALKAKKEKAVSKT